MEQFLTPSNIMFTIGIIGLLFTIWEKVKGPQTKSEQEDALFSQRLSASEKTTAEKFSEMSKRLDASMTLAQNHVHTVDVKVDGLISTVTLLGNEVVKLSTIIDERIPRK